MSSKNSPDWEDYVVAGVFLFGVISAICSAGYITYWLFTRIHFV